MPRVEVLPNNAEIEAFEDETILQALLRHGIDQAHACGGKARCSTCRLLILEGLQFCSPRTPDEQRIAERLHFSPTIRLACQTYLSGPAKIRRLIIDDEDVELHNIAGADNSTVAVRAGVEKRLFILFADIQGFTTFAGTLMPYDVVHVLNRFFNFMNRAVRQQHGCINSYMGDGLMALFEAADPAAGAEQSIRAGLAMLLEVKKMQPYLHDLYRRSLDIRIGLHYGQVVAGEIGALGDRKETVIGDAVNVASRIEAANKEVGSHFLISETVYDFVKEKIAVGKIVQVNLPGISQRHTLYEVLELPENSRG